MLYLLAIVLPPVAVLIAGKPIQALINVPLTLLAWIPGVIHALFVVHNHYADVRTDRLARTITAAGVAQAAAAQRQTMAATAAGRIVCPACGHDNARGRQSCKRCKAPLA